MAKKQNKSSPSYNDLKVEALRSSPWNKTKLKSILNKTKGKRILVIGDVGLDRYTIGTVERISPEAPVPIVFVQEEKLKLGLAANVADNIQALGGVPLLVGVVGKDRGAEDFIDLLKTSEIQHTHLVTDSTRRTVLKERVVSERQQLVRVDYESIHAINETIEKSVFKKVREVMASADGVIIEDYAKGLLSQSLIKSIVSLAKRSNKMVAVDPNLKTSVQFYKDVTVLTPNTKEAQHLSGVEIRDEESLLKAGFAILKSTLAKHVVITRGKDGMAIFTRGNTTVKLIPTYAREVYDVSGAGDTVISVLVMSLVTGASIEEAAILGNLAAGVEVGKRGTATVSPDDIRTALEIFSP